MSFYGSLVRASATLSFGADPVATDAVTIGDRTYTYVATPTAADEVAVGTDRDESISNLEAAINGGAGEGTAYGTGTAENEFVSASADLANDDLVITAKLPGTFGNGITVSTSETDILFDDTAVTLESGVGDLEAIIDEAIDVLQLNAEAISFLRHLTAASD